MKPAKFPMPIPAVPILVCVFLILICHAIAFDAVAAQSEDPDKNAQASGSEELLPAQVPNLSDVIPLATELSGRLTTLKREVGDLLDVSVTEERFTDIETNLTALGDLFESLKISEEYSYNKLMELSEELKREIRFFEEISKPLSRAIDQLGIWRDEWIEERSVWSDWQSSLLREGQLDQLKPTFEAANRTIDEALELVLQKLEQMLALQGKAGSTQEKMIAFAAELDSMMESRRRYTLLNASPPMFSPQYFSQFGSDLWSATRRSFDEIAWPGSRVFSRQGWIVIIQFFISLFVIIFIIRRKRKLDEIRCLRFLVGRPISAGLFLGYMVTVLIYEYAGVPVVWKLATMVVAAVCFARLMQARTETAWKRHFVYWLMTVLIINSFMDAINFPLPLFRLYILLATLTGLFLFWRWAPKSGGAKGSGFYTWLLRLASFFFAFMVIAQIWGRTALPLQIFVSLIDSTATVLVFMLLMSIIHGILEWLYRASPLHQAMRFGDEDTDAVIRHTVKAMYFAIWTFVLLPAIFMIWGFYNDLEEATQGILSLGFNIGSQRISIGLLIVALAILYGSYFASSIIERLLMKGLLIRRSLEMGVRHAIARLVHYFLIFMAFLLAISALGFDITKLTIMLSALGVGIGFGLQTIVNNFVSGLILLFERPVRVGDTVEFGGNWANIKKIGLRATTVETFDNADVIIPNADLVGNQVTNWTLTSRQVRLIVPVGVAYGSDVPLVIEKLMSCARSNPLVVEKPAPQVLFLGFGESSLDFELRAWVTNFDNRLRVISELHQEIDRSFRKAKIEIAFPQRDLHLRSVDESVSLTQTGNSDYR